MNALSISNGDLNSDDTTQETKPQLTSSSTTSSSLTNGRVVHPPHDENNFLVNDINDDCNSDCIYKDNGHIDEPDIGKKLSHQQLNNNNNNNNTTIDATTTSNLIDDDDDDDDDDETNVIDKTELDLNKTLQFPCELEDIDFNNMPIANNANCTFESICLKTKDNNVINSGCEFKNDDSDTECTDPSESKSENTVCDIIDSKKDVLKSVETSTETLVSESIKCR